MPDLLLSASGEQNTAALQDLKLKGSAAYLLPLLLLRQLEQHAARQGARQRAVGLGGCAGGWVAYRLCNGPERW